MSQIRCVQTKSAIRVNEKHKRILKSLGLRGVGSLNHLPDCVGVRGMVAKVSYLVEVEYVE
jgi:ribosomal protein L30